MQRSSPILSVLKDYRSLGQFVLAHGSQTSDAAVLLFHPTLVHTLSILSLSKEPILRVLEPPSIRYSVKYSVLPTTEECWRMLQRARLSVAQRALLSVGLGAYSAESLRGHTQLVSEI